MSLPREHHLIVERTARYYTLGRDDGMAREIWIVLHGQGQLGTHFIESFRALDNGERLIVAPEGLSRYYTRPSTMTVGASWMTREDRLNEIRDYVDYLDALLAHVLDMSTVDNPEIVLFGFSQGGATAARCATYGKRQPDRLVIWGSDVPPDLKLDVLKERIDAGMSFSMVAGRSDEYITPKIAQAQRDLLEQAGVPYQWREFEGGHEVDPDVLTSMAPGSD